MCSLISIFFTKWQPFNDYETYFFHLKSFFHSWDIQIFIFPSSPLFLLIKHCFTRWSKINLKVYDVINCLNKNLITYFVWYFKKEKRHHTETLSIDRVLHKTRFYVPQKLVSNPFLILLSNSKKPLHARNSWKKIIKKP